VSDKIQKYELLRKAVQEKTEKWRSYVGEEWLNIEKHSIAAILAQDKEILADGNFFLQHSFAPLATDVLIQRLIDTVGKNGNAAFLGADTDIAKSVVSLAATLLANAKNCLIVAQDETILASIADSFAALPFADLMAYLNRDEYAAQLASLRQAAAKMPQGEALPRTMPFNLVRLLRSAAGQISALQNFHKCYYAPLAGYSDYSAALAAYLSLPAESSHNTKLLSLLTTSKLTFSANEQRELWQLTQEAAMLWAKNTSNHVFSDLHSRFYSLPNSRQVAYDLQQSLTRMLQATSAAQTDIFSYLYQYEKSVEDHFVELYVEKLNLIRALHKACEAAKKINAQLFADPKSTTGQTGSWFSKHKNEAEFLDLQTEIHDTHKTLCEKHFLYLYVAHDFIDISRHDTALAELVANLNDYENKLALWYRSRSEYLESHLQNLQPEHIHPHSQQRATIINALRGLELLTQNINQSRIFAQPLALAQPSLNERLAQLALFSEKISKMLQDWANFEAHHAFRYFMLQVNSKYQPIFELLEQEKCLSWRETLQYCYLHQALAQRVAQPQWQTETEIAQILANLDKDTADYQSELSDFIRDLHGEKRRAALTKSKNMPTLAPADFATIFPITITTAERLAQILPFAPHSFDLIILADAQDMPLAEILPARWRARFCLAMAAQYTAPTTEINAETTFIAHFLGQKEVPRLYAHLDLPAQAADIAQIISTYLSVHAPEYQIDISIEIAQQNLKIIVPLLLRQDKARIALFFVPILVGSDMLMHKWQQYLQAKLPKCPEPIIPIFVYTSAWQQNAEKANQTLLAQIQALRQ
jgi:hypothetical protein